MSHFVLHLTPENGDDTPTTDDATALREHVRSHPFIESVAGDPARLIYRNPETTTHFAMTLGDAVIDGDRATFEDPYDPPMPASRDVLTTGADGVGTSRADEEADDSEWEDEDEDAEDDDEDGDDDVEFRILPPLTLDLPLFRPTFFVVEALHLIESLTTGTSFAISLPASEVPVGESSASSDASAVPASTVSRADLMRHWNDLHHDVYPDLSPDERQHVQRWNADRSAAFFDFANHAQALRTEFAGHDVAVAQPARCAEAEGIHTLCVWQTDRPTVLPEADLVLVRRRRARRSLLGRIRYDEFIVDGKSIRALLEPLATKRYDPHHSS